MTVAFPKEWNDRTKSPEERLLERVVQLLTPPPPPEPLAKRRARLERQMAVFGFKPSDYTQPELIAMGYHERHVPSWKRKE